MNTRLGMMNIEVVDESDEVDAMSPADISLELRKSKYGIVA